jgi:hypothetical protein
MRERREKTHEYIGQNDFQRECLVDFKGAPPTRFAVLLLLLPPFFFSDD